MSWVNVSEDLPTPPSAGADHDPHADTPWGPAHPASFAPVVDADPISFAEGYALAEIRRALVASPHCYDSSGDIEPGSIVRVVGPSSLASFGEVVGIRLGLSDDRKMGMIAAWSYSLNRIGTFWVPLERYQRLFLSLTTLRVLNRTARGLIASS